MVLSHYASATTTTHPDMLPHTRPEILEKPQSKADNLRMLLELNGGTCEVVTGVSLGNGDPFADLSVDLTQFLQCIRL